MSVAVAKRPVGRPRIELDKNLIYELAKIHCTNEEIAAILKVSADTIERNFAGLIKEGKAEGKTSLRRYMWLKAQQGDSTMMIWLSKNLLGYRDKVDMDIEGTVTVKPLSAKEISEAIKADQMLELTQGKDFKNLDNREDDENTD